MKDSKHFVNMIKDERVCGDEILVTFDEKSLFTNVQVEEALRVIFDMLKNDESLADRTVLSADIFQFWKSVL